MTHRRVLYAAMLAILGGIAACDRTEQLGQLTGPATPQFAWTADGVKIMRTKTPLSDDLTYKSGSPVGSSGGVMNFGSHTLLVPANAVSSPTYFSATIRKGDVVKVDLRAWTTNGDPVTQFAVPVKVTLDLSSVADNITDWSSVVVLYYNPNGTLEPMQSVVDVAGKKVTATLPHFSDYSPGWNNTDTTTVAP